MSLIMSPEGQPGGVVSVLIDRVILQALDLQESAYPHPVWRD